MKNKKTLGLAILVFSHILLFSGVVNPDKPSKGEWDFKPAKVWEIHRAGHDIFARINTLLVAADDTLYVSDGKNRVTYWLDKEGRLIKTFARQGEGPGEVRYNMESYLVGDTFIIADFDRLHYFDKEGKFNRSVRNVFFRRRPVVFLNENEFIAAPINLFQTSEKKGGIIKVNLKTGKETVFSQFRVFTGGSIHRRGGPAREIIIVGLSPLMTIGLGQDKLYYGMSDTYTIEVVDLDGKELNTFSLDRQKKRVSDDMKKKLFEGIPHISEDVVKHLMGTIPNETTYFYRLEVHHGLIYVYVPDPLHRFPGHRKPAWIDIFSGDGKYLYKAHLKLTGSAKPLTTRIHKDHLYLVLEDQEGEISLAKYTLSLPK
jgi:hypothetical protein